MKNNHKIILFALFLCVNILPVKSQNAEIDPDYFGRSPWDEMLNEKDGVHVARVKMPKYVTTRYTYKKSYNNLHSDKLWESSLGLSATFIDAKTGKQIKFYDGNDYFLNEGNNYFDHKFRDKQSLESDLFRTDESGLYYDVLRLKSIKTYKVSTGGRYDNLLESKIENSYKLKSYNRGVELHIYYFKHVINGVMYRIFLDYADIRSTLIKAE